MHRACQNLVRAILARQRRKGLGTVIRPSLCQLTNANMELDVRFVEFFSPHCPHCIHFGKSLFSSYRLLDFHFNTTLLSSHVAEARRWLCVAGDEPRLPLRQGGLHPQWRFMQGKQCPVFSLFAAISPGQCYRDISTKRAQLGQARWVYHDTVRKVCSINNAGFRTKSCRLINWYGWSSTSQRTKVWTTIVYQVLCTVVSSLPAHGTCLGTYG